MKDLYFNPNRGAVEVKRGFNWGAAVFGSLWAVAHRMWYPHVVTLVPIEGILWLLGGYAEAHESVGMVLFVSLAAIALFLVKGRFGSQWLERSLVRRGYSRHAPLGNAA